MLLCLEASAEDAARTRLDEGRAATCAATTRPTRARRPRARSTLALEAARAVRPRRARALARHAGLRPDGRRADDVHEGAGSTRWPDAVDATPLLAAARAIKTDAGDRADPARERDLRGGDGARARRAPARDEGERGGRDLAGVRPRRGHRLARAASSSRSASRSSGRAPGSRRSPRPATGRCPADEPTLFEIWVCADGYWCDHTKLALPGRAARRLPRARGAAARGLRSRDRALPARARASPSSTG